MTSATSAASGSASSGESVLLIDVLVPVRLVTESNNDRHWRKRATRAKAQRSTAFLMARAVDGWRVFNPAKRYRVLITRIAPRELDSDNLTSSAKHVRDGIADALAIDDRDKRVEWDVDYEKGAPHTYAARVRIWEVR